MSGSYRHMFTRSRTIMSSSYQLCATTAGVLGLAHNLLKKLIIWKEFREWGFEYLKDW